MLSSVTFSERLLEALEAARKSRADLARHLNVSQAALTQLVKGRTGALNAENTAKAAAFLRVECLWLATGEGPMRAAEFSPMAADLARRFDQARLEERDRLYALLLYQLQLASARPPAEQPQLPAPTSEPDSRR